MLSKRFWLVFFIICGIVFMMRMYGYEERNKQIISIMSKEE